MRLDSGLRFALGAEERFVGRVGYRRVSESENGYHALRAAASFRVITPLKFTTDWYWYLYDEAVRHSFSAAAFDTTLSWVGATNAEWTFNESWAALLGGSIGQSPYAALDAQAIARVRMNLNWGPQP